MNVSGTKNQRGGLRSDQLSGLMLLALALYVGWENRAYPIGTLQEPGPGYMPLLLAVFLGVIERRRPLPAAMVALGFGFASYYVVGDLLHVPLPRSPWGF